MHHGVDIAGSQKIFKIYEFGTYYLDNNNRPLSIWRSFCKIGGFVLGRGTLRGSAATELSTEYHS